MHVLVDVDARRRATALAHVDEEPDVARDNCLIEVAVLADDHGTLPAELERDLLEVGLARGHDDLFADGRRASECDLVDAHVSRDHVARRARAVENVDHARGEASLLDELTHLESTQRRLLRELHHTAVLKVRRPTLFAAQLFFTLVEITIPCFQKEITPVQKDVQPIASAGASFHACILRERTFKRDYC